MKRQSRINVEAMKSRRQTPGRRSPPRLTEYIWELIDAQLSEPNEHPGIVQIVIGDVERFRIFFHQSLTLLEVNGDDQRLTILVLAREQLAFDFPRRRTVRGPFFDAGQRKRELAHSLKGNWDWFLIATANAFG